MSPVMEALNVEEPREAVRQALTAVPAHPADMRQTKAALTQPAATGAEGADVPIRGTQITDEPLIDLRTLSRWLGVSESTVRKWAARGPAAGLLPTMIRVNGQIRFRPSDVRSYLTDRELR